MLPCIFQVFCSPAAYVVGGNYSHKSEKYHRLEAGVGSMMYGSINACSSCKSFYKKGIKRITNTYFDQDTEAIWAVLKVHKCHICFISVILVKPKDLLPLSNY